MKVSTEKIEPSQVVLNVEVDPETIEKSLDQAHRRLASRLNIPGFRKGKAPRAMVERFVGRPALLEEALDKLVPELYQQILKDEQIDAVSQPTFEITQLEPVAFKATVPVRPEVDLGDYQSVRIEIPSVEVTDAEVDAVITDLRDRQATWEPVERPAELNDQVTIDIVGHRNGEAATVVDQKDLEYPLIATLRVPVPGFAEQLVGVASGETKEIHLEFAEDSEHTEIAGSTFDFTVTVHEVKVKQLPELNDEFAHEVDAEFESLAALRERITENIRRRKQNEQTALIEEKALDAALEKARLELAPTLVEREVESLQSERERALAAQQISMETYLRITQQSEEAMKAEFEVEAIRRLRRRFVLDELAKREGLAAEPAEIEADVQAAQAAELARHVGHRHRPPSPRAFDRPEIREALAEVIRRRKAVRRLIEIATEGQYPPADEAETPAAAATGAVPEPTAEQASAVPTAEE